MNASKEIKDCSAEFVVEDAVPTARNTQISKETDTHRITQRQKQIDLGKNTLGYQLFRQQVPRADRRPRQDPMTPDVYQKCSKRSFDGQVKKWRRMLHEWDPKDEDDQEKLQASAGVSSYPPLKPSSLGHNCVNVASEDRESHRPSNKRKTTDRSPLPSRGQRMRKECAALGQHNEPSDPCKQDISMSALASQLESTCRASQQHGATFKHAQTLTPLLPSSKNTVMQLSATVLATNKVSADCDNEELVDYGEDEEWAYIDAEVLTGGTTVYNNWGALEDTELDEIAI